jgi:phosphate transport system permease protein
MGMDRTDAAAAAAATAGRGLDAAPANIVMPPRRRAAARGQGQVDRLYHGASLVVALGLVVTLGALVVMLLATAWPAIGRLGPGFFVGTVWNSTSDVYGALPFIAGTVITTALALLIAVPVSLAIAILLTEYAPRPLAATLGVVIDVAAGVPTIVFGVWALLALYPWMRDTAEPAVAAVLGWLPLFNRNDISGEGMLTAGVVLAAMVFPTIVVVTRNAILAVPMEMREASLGLGATRWETATRVALRQARPGLLGGVILACGRALGEIMAIIYILGTVPRLPNSLFDVGNTIAAQLFTQALGVIPGTLTIAALYELGLILLALSLLTSLGGRFLTRLSGTTSLAGGGR